MPYSRCYHSEYPDVLHEAVAMGKKITAEAIHWSTMRYIADDFHRNGHKYAPADRERIFNLIKNC
jgi:hypothetical protein